jgi:hypothetical protein
VVVTVIEVGEALQAVSVVQVTVLDVLVDGVVEPSPPVEKVEIKTVVVVQSEKVVLDVQVEEEDVEDSDSDDELLSSSSFILFSMLVTMLLISTRYSEPFLMVFSMSSVNLVTSSGIVLIMLSAIGLIQLSASSAMSFAVSTAPLATFAALEARFPIAPNKDLFLREPEPEQGDLVEGYPILER